MRQAASQVARRAPGLLSFVLSAMKVDPTLSLRCFADRVEVVEAGLGGRETVVIPLQKVSSIIGGHSRSLASLVAAGIFGFFGALGMFAGVVGSGEMGGALIGSVFWLVLSAVALARFFLSRSMVLRFGQGMIEGVDVNPARVQQAVDMLNRATMSANQVQLAGGAPMSGRQALTG